AEISLVYRGAIPHTRIGAALGFAESNLCDDSSEVSDEPTLPNHGSFLKRLRLERVSALAAQGPGEAEPDGILTQLPAFPASVAGAELYEGLPVLVGRSGGKMFVLRDDGVDAPQRLFEAALGAGEYPREDFLLYGRLIGMRGKQRRSLSELARRLNSNAGPVRSYRLRLIAFLYLNHAWLDEANSASFRQECGRLCRDQRRLVESSVANCEGPGERPNDVRGREIVLTGRPGEFCFLRLSNTPLTLARNLPLSSNVPATLTLEHSPLSERMADAGRSAGADTVQLRFDDVSENHGRLSLINPRVGARLGELCAEESYLLFNAGPRQTCRKRDDFLRITDTAGATHSVALAESYEGNAGLVHILAEIGRTVTDGVQTAAVIPGATVRLANQNGAVSPMRVIQLDCGKTTRLALIHSAEAPDARAG
ncbi:MAG: hypothetical protein ACE5GA_06005, partial [Candidatus Zixiibacteriota bacterium]